jgi:archaellum biogenesis ATPase FlaH
MAENCDTVFNINQILPNVINAINGNKFHGMKIKQEKLSTLLNENNEIKEGVILFFSENNLIDIMYKKNTTSFLKKFKNIMNENTFIIILYEVEEVSNQEIALKMILNYLNLILNNCDD